VLRISPQSRHTEQVVVVFDQWRNGLCSGREANEALQGHMPSGVCNGYWLGEAGMHMLPAGPGAP